MIDYFEVVEVEEVEKSIILHLEEKSLSPSEVSGRSFISKVFYQSVDIRDFPIRVKGCILRMRRRRWQGNQTGAPYMRDWDIIADGTRLTREFAAFLEELSI